MTRMLTLLSVVLCCLTLVTCGERATAPSGDNGIPRKPANPEQVSFPDASTCGRQALVRADNTFGLALFREVTETDPGSNVVVSPLSVALALGMTVNGAAGTTLSDMKDVLGLSGYSMDQVNHQYRDLIHVMLTLDPEVELEIANSIWCREGIPFKQDFLDACHTYFSAQTRGLDFSRPDAAGIINAWVSDQTHDRITEIVDPVIDPLTMIFLIDAVYFKGSWLHAFDPEETYDTWFTLPDGTDVPCRMMCQPETTDFYTLLSTPEFDALDMPYGDSVFSMTVLLPKNGRTVGSLIGDLTPSDWDIWMKGFIPWSGKVFLPRFEVEYDVNLNDALTAMGMGIIFDSFRADFTRMCDVFQDFYVKKVKHKTYIRVDEIGTEAAAVTSVEMGPTSLPNFFLVNRPFIFAIRENRFNTILFIGQITDPGYLTD
jgi:serine protease inhibitor